MATTMNRKDKKKEHYYVNAEYGKEQNKTNNHHMCDLLSCYGNSYFSFS